MKVTRTKLPPEASYLHAKMTSSLYCLLSVYTVLITLSGIKQPESSNIIRQSGPKLFIIIFFQWMLVIQNSMNGCVHSTQLSNSDLMCQGCLPRILQYSLRQST